MALSFAIKLTDQVSPGAKAAGASLQALHSQLQSESAALKALETQMRALEKGGTGNLDLYKKMSTALADQRNKVADLTAGMVKAGGAGFAPAKASAGALENVLGQLVNKGGAASEAMASLGPEAMAAAAGLGAAAIAGAALVGAFVAVAGAVVYLESKLISLGIAASETKGDITRSLELLYGSEKAAQHTYAVLESLTGDIAISQGRVMELADTLIKAGQVNGDAMVRSIATIGKAEAARAGAGKVLEGVITRATSSRMFSISRNELMQVGLSYKQLAAEVSKGVGITTQEAELRLRTGGVRVKEGLEALGRVVDAKMGDLAMKKFQTVGVQTQRLKDGFARLFEGVDSGPFARLLMVIANQLEASSVSGAALRTIVKSAFEEISKAAEFVAPYVQAFFEGAILLALKFYNAMYPVRQSIAKMFGGTNDLSTTQDKILAFARNAQIAFEAMAKALKFVIDNLGGAAKAVSAVATQAVDPGGAGKRTYAVGAWTHDYSGANKAAEAAANDNGKAVAAATNAGKRVAEGTAAGIQAGAPAVEKAMVSMAQKGTAAYDAEMEIHSPSRVMQVKGQFLMAGLVKGVNDNASMPAKALADSTPQQTGGASSQPRQDNGGGGITVQVTFADGSIQIAQGGDVTAIRDELTEMMADVFQQAAQRQGAA